MAADSFPDELSSKGDLIANALTAFENRDTASASKSLHQHFIAAVERQDADALSTVIYVCWRMTGYLDPVDGADLERLMVAAARARNRGSTPPPERLAQAHAAFDAGDMTRVADILGEPPVPQRDEAGIDHSAALDRIMSLVVELRSDSARTRDELGYVLDTVADLLDPPDDEESARQTPAGLTPSISDEPGSLERTTQAGDSPALGTGAVLSTEEREKRLGIVLEAANLVLSRVDHEGTAFPDLTQAAIKLCGKKILAHIESSDKPGLFVPIDVEANGKWELGCILTLQDRAVIAWFIGTLRVRTFAQVVFFDRITGVAEVATEPASGHQPERVILRVDADEPVKIRVRRIPGWPIPETLQDVLAGYISFVEWES